MYHSSERCVVKYDTFVHSPAADLLRWRVLRVRLAFRVYTNYLLGIAHIRSPSISTITKHNSEYEQIVTVLLISNKYSLAYFIRVITIGCSRGEGSTTPCKLFVYGPDARASVRPFSQEEFGTEQLNKLKLRTIFQVFN